MRKLVWTLLTTDDSLVTDEGIAPESVISTQAADTPTGRPFIILSWGPNVAGIGPVTVRTLTVWVHDEPADYTRIDRILTRVKFVLGSADAMQDPDGGWLTQAEWTDDSGDLADDGYGTITRSTSFRVVGSAQ